MVMCSNLVLQDLIRNLYYFRRGLMSSIYLRPGSYSNLSDLYSELTENSLFQVKIYFIKLSTTDPGTSKLSHLCVRVSIAVS